VPCAPVNDLADVLADPQLASLGLLQDVGGLPVVRPPLSFDDASLAHRSPAPALGADTRAILGEAGYDAATVDRLVAEGIVAAP
jgi:crotonobetainyl-CoA:carnitine CoA-transferase CaiB-like acyl-CoA transferase